VSAKDMSKIYFSKTTVALEMLKSEKQSKIRQLERSYMGYLDKQDLRKLRHQVKQIEAVIESRRLQQELPL